MAIVKGTNSGELIDGLAGVTNGDDLIKGYGGNDIIYAGGGDDVIQGGLGADKITGGAGDDTANYIDSTTGVTVNLSAGTGKGGTAEGDTLFQIENVTGSNFNDNLIGDDGANWLYGRDGNDILKGYGQHDRLWGGAGEDMLYGMQGDDMLLGEAGEDELSGGAGFDTMVGGTGRDTLTGGADPDSFVWHLASETGLTEATADRIKDFSLAEGDWIDLADVDANVYAAGDQAFTFIGTAAFSGAPGELRYYYSGGNTYIEMQTGVDLDVEGVIRLDGIVTPQASWFSL